MLQHIKSCYSGKCTSIRRTLRSRFISRKSSRSALGSPFATHLPVLIGLSRTVSPRRVLELGAGFYSTGLFLNRAVFPELEELHSFENDAEWFDRLLPHTQRDARSHLTLHRGPMCQVIDHLKLEQYDLILIDDSQTLRERCETIDCVANQIASAKLCVIHDFNNKEYRHAARRFPHRFRFDALFPETGVCWSGADVLSKQLRAINREIARNASQIGSDAVTDWVARFADMPLE